MTAEFIIIMREEFDDEDIAMFVEAEDYYSAARQAVKDFANLDKLPPDTDDVTHWDVPDPEYPDGSRVFYVTNIITGKFIRSLW